jgi:hypothetical protein
MDFDKATVPAIRTYRNQGELVANIAGFAELISDKAFSSDILGQLLKDHNTCFRVS